MLEEVYYDNSLKEWLISLIIIVGSFLISKLILSINKKFIFKLAKKTNSRLNEILIRTLESPLLFGIILVALWIGLSRLNLDKNFEKYLSEAYKVLTVLNITWFIKCLLHAIIFEYLTPKTDDAVEKKRFNFDSHTVSIVQKTSTSLIWTIGIVVALSNIGVNIGALLGTLGVGGIAFALAAQDTIKNIFGGFTILTDGTFRIGDRVKVDTYDGHVENIGVRSTRIRTLDKRLVIIPNYKIVEGAVENVSEEPMFRVLMKLGLVYGTTPAKMNRAMEILKEIAIENQNTDNDTIMTFFSSFDDYALTITYIYYIKKGSDIFGTSSEINLKILEKFNKEGIEFAFPTQTLYVQKETEQVN